MRIRYDYPQYLSAKKSVDDRALNLRIWQQMIQALEEMPAAPIKILEIAAGIGTMIERLLDALSANHIEYTAIDISPENISTMEKRMTDWGEKHRYSVSRRANEIHLTKNGRKIVIILICTDVLGWLKTTPQNGYWDLLVSNAFLDLVDLSEVLPGMAHLITPEGRYYFTINFDGETIFRPEIDPALEKKIFEAYHRTMDERLINGKQSGHSQTGRKLFDALPKYGLNIIAAGASDWVVFPGGEKYPHQEAYFLKFILETIYRALEKDGTIEKKALQNWTEKRYHQIETGELSFIAHQLDFFGAKI